MKNEIDRKGLGRAGVCGINRKYGEFSAKNLQKQVSTEINKNTVLYFYEQRVLYGGRALPL